MGLLRFLFALSVVAAHTGSILGVTFIGGKMAVQSFFILSGFYMALILDKKYIGKNGSYKLFITNRILRLYPTYLVVLVIAFALSFLWLILGSSSKLDYYNQYHVLQNPILLIYFLVSQFFIIGLDLVMFIGLNVSGGNLFFTNDYLNTKPLLHDFIFIPQAWTLSLEFIFYAIAPFLLRKKTVYLILAILASLLIRFWLYSIGLHKEPWTNRFLPTELAFFLLGALVYKYSQIIKKITISKYAILTFYILFVAATVFYNRINVLEIKSLDLVQGAYFSSLLVGIPFIFDFTQKNVIDRFLGMLSYPVYITHAFVADILIHINKNNSAFLGINTAIFSILFSIALFFLLEKPIEKYRQSRLKIKK